MIPMTILKIPIDTLTKTEILEKIKKNTLNRDRFIHVLSLNPENMVLAYRDKSFRETVMAAQIRILDGAGLVLAGQILNVPIGERLTGVDLMEAVLKEADKRPLRVVLIGGRGNLALQLAQCYNRKYPKAKFIGAQGIKEIKNPKKDEEEKIFSIVANLRPHIVIAAFGSPSQELWLYRNRKKLGGVVCIGVGGAFDYLGGSVSRAPLIIRKAGFEWLFRLFSQPWRWRRQLRLFEFGFLVLRQKLGFLKI